MSGSLEQHLSNLRRERREKEQEVIARLPHGVPYHPYTNSDREVDLREWVAEQSERNGLGVTLSFKMDDLVALIDAVASCPLLVADGGRMADKVWLLRSAAINEAVRAEDQFAAWDTLRDRDTEDFGLVVTAERDEDGDPIPVRTSALMFSWGRDEDAEAFIAAAVANGLPDTTDADRRFGHG